MRTQRLRRVLHLARADAGGPGFGSASALLGVDAFGSVTHRWAVGPRFRCFRWFAANVSNYVLKPTADRSSHSFTAAAGGGLARR
jgi:hypothetical protein